MSAPFELEITVCAGGSGHVTTAIEVQNLADLESLSRAVAAAIQVWQETRDPSTSTRASVSCSARSWPSCSRPDGQALRHWVSEPWWTNSGSPCSTPTDDPLDDPSYQRFLGECAKDCRCEGPDVPCAVVTSGGVCDEMSSELDDEDWGDPLDDPWEPEQ